MLPTYKRFPALSQNSLAFVYEDDLWIASSQGGAAWRLVTGFGEIRYPDFSPSGDLLGFTSNVEGSFEVYVCPVEGGQPARLTFEGCDCALIGFRPNGKILFRSSRESPFPKQTFVYEIAPDGTELARLPVGRAAHVAFDTDNDQVVLGLDQLDPARWKRYRGGTAGKIWIGSLQERNFRRLIEGQGNPVLPTFANGRVYFIADTNGLGNIWSCTVEGDDFRQHTQFSDYYCRWLKGYGNTLVFQKGGELLVYETVTDELSQSDLAIRPSGIQLQRKFVDAEDHLQELDLALDGRQLAATVRGKALTMQAWGGAVRQFGQRSGVRYRDPIWLANNQELAVISDEGGEEALEIHKVASRGKEVRLPLEGIGRLTEIVARPVGRGLAACDVAGKLVVVDLDGGNRLQEVDQTPHGAIREPTWSPDGRWLAYVMPISSFLEGGIIHLHDTDSGMTAPLNSEELPAHSPSFDPQSRFLYVVSERTFNPVLDPIAFRASCPVAGRIYAFVLSREEFSPFDPRWVEQIEGAEGDQDPPGPNSTQEKPEPVRIDLEGLGDRLVEFPDIELGTYSDLQAAVHKLLYLQHPFQGLLDWDLVEEDEARLPSLICYDMKTAKQTTMLEGVHNYCVRGDKTLVWSSKGLYLLDTGHKPPEEPSRPGYNRHTGAIDRSRLRAEIVPAGEWRQMFIEAWRLQRDHFWTETMAGIDWEAVREHYLPLLEAVTTRAELSDLIWELQGELGTSHAYEFGGDYPTNRDYPVGGMGAKLRWDGIGYRVDRILDGDSWSWSASSPLAAPGVNVGVGERITAIDGQPLSEATTPESLLVHRADTEVELTLDPVDGERPRQVVVHTLASERQLRYRDWVKRNRSQVRRRSEGQLGYLHIPDMGGFGLGEFFRSFRSQSKHPGLIIDVRNNGGGFISQLVLDYLRRRVIGYECPRYGQPETYPTDAVRGPMVVVCDQFTGSDGDIFSYAFKAEQLGPLIGKRTWGGVIGVEINEFLADGTVVTQPEFSFFFNAAGWGVENHGVDPDVEVDLDPASAAIGVDPQLDQAVGLALEALARDPVTAPDWPEIPSRSIPR